MTVVSVLLGLCLIPTAAVAESVEVTHCDAGPGAIYPQRVYENVTVGNPFTPREVEVADSESAPEGSLTATANWGDGTSTAAEMKPGSMGGCFILSTSAHTYANPGPVTFSYTIHNSHTGVDHQTDEEKLYVWSVPTLIPGSTPGAIAVQVGKPWSGVVGEFSYDSAQMSASQYSTRIDWGDLLASPGTITALPNGRFSVSGSHSYTQPLSGRVIVDVFGSYEDLGLASWPIASVLASATPPLQTTPTTPVAYKLLRTPILAAISSRHRTKTYALILRLSSPLPSGRTGEAQATLSMLGHRSSLTAFGPHRAHACYTSRLAPAPKPAPKVGAHYPFRLSIQGPAASISTVAGKAHTHLYPRRAVMLTSAAKTLGC